MWKRKAKKQAERLLISWAESRRYERFAKEILCITPHLIWARCNINEIMRSISQDNSKRFRYIVVNNNSFVKVKEKEHNAFSFARANAREIIDAVSRNSEIASLNPVEILFLPKGGSVSDKCLWSVKNGVHDDGAAEDFLNFPLPTDIALYVDTADGMGSGAQRKTFAVISVNPVDKVFSEMDGRIPLDEQLEHGIDGDGILEEKFDFRLEDPEHCNPIRAWFNSEWGKLPA